ncbi:MAG: ABC transporter permease [Gorillibacterium sp.]|nr:ABC transporter permease [Gorillibacterium sp.]
MITLIRKEIRMLLRSIVFYLLIIVAGLFYFSQYATQNTWHELKAPTPPVEQQNVEHPNYGWRAPTDVQTLSSNMIRSMTWELEEGTTYKTKLVINTKVKLSEQEKVYFQQTITKLRSLVEQPEGHTMDDAWVLSEELNEKLGGNSMYQEGMTTYSSAIETYEDALLLHEESLVQYNEKVKQGELLPGAARLFSDYMAITAGIFPVFLAAFLLTRDRSSRMYELINSRRISAWKYVSCRFFAFALLLSAVYLLYSLMAAWQTVQAIGIPGQLGSTAVTFVAYTAAWVLPTIWTSIAFGMFASMLLRSSIAAIALNIIWWFHSMLPLTGSYGLTKLLIRFNTPDEYLLYRESIQTILVNRLFYTGLVILLVGATAFLWERSRCRETSGRFRLGRNKHHELQPAVSER